MLLSFVTSANLPFRIIENEQFSELFSYISSDKAKLPARKTLIADLVTKSDAIKSELKNIIARENFFCTTADVWTNRNRSFLGLTIHYFNSNLDKQSFLLAFRRLYGRHTHENLAEKIIEVNREFNLIRSKITHIVTDGGSNFCKAFRRFGENQEPVTENETEIEDSDDVEIEESLGPETEVFVSPDTIAETIDFRRNVDYDDFYDDFETLPKQMRCKSHNLNLVGAVDFEKNLLKLNARAFDALDSAYEKLKSFWTLSRRSTVAHEIIEKTCKRSFPYPNSTRWNSKFDCIEIAIKHSRDINIAIDEVNQEAQRNLTNSRSAKKLIKLSANDWRSLEDYTATLRPVSIALDILQGEKRACQGYILPTLYSIMAALQKNLDEHIYISDYGRIMHDAMIDSLNRRFGDIMKINDSNKDLVIAATVHPNFKLGWIEQESDKEFAQNLLINAYVLLANTHKTQIEEIPNNNDSIATNGKSKEQDFFKYIRSNERRTSTDETLTLEVWKYIVQPTTDDISSQISQIKALPVLEELFRKYNTTLSSSAPVERIFSNALMIFTPRRNRISDDHFERSLLVRRNAELLKSR